MTYEEQLEKLNQELFKPKVFEAFAEVAAMARMEGWDTNPILDLTDEEYRYDMEIVGIDGLEDGIACIEVTMLEERVNEGEGTGVSFDVTITAMGGIVLGSFAPYNFTPKLWDAKLGDTEAIGQRLESVIQTIESFEVIMAIKEGRDRLERSRV